MTSCQVVTTNNITLSGVYLLGVIKTLLQYISRNNSSMPYGNLQSVIRITNYVIMSVLTFPEIT